MNKSIKISIIIPCYNVEKYIGDCLQSIYSQDIDENDFEVICVNDCSPDDTENIVLEWQKKHKNLHLINHDVNKRQSAARNTGLRAAKGKYIWFIDGDDMIKENCLTSILKMMEDNNLDLLLFNPTEDKTRIYREEMPVSGIEYMENWLKTGKQSDTMYCIWARVARRELILSNNLFFREDIIMAEDVSYSYKMCCYSQRVMATYDVFYLNRPVNISSVTRSALTADKLFSAVFLNPQELIEVADYAKKHSLFVADALKEDAVFWLSRLKSLFSKMTVKQQRKFIRLCKEKTNFINEITKKAGVNTKMIYNPNHLRIVMLTSFMKRTIKKIIR